MQAKQRIGLTDATTFIHKMNITFFLKREKVKTCFSARKRRISYYINTLFNKTKIFYNHVEFILQISIHFVTKLPPCVFACIEKAQVCLDNFQVLIGELLVNFISFWRVLLSQKISFQAWRS